MSELKPLSPDKEFAAAIKLFENDSSELSPRGLGDSYLKQWRRGPCQIVAYAKRQQLKLAIDELNLLESLVSKSLENLKQNAIVILNQVEIPRNTPAATQLVHLVQGHARVILAACALGNWTANRDRPLPESFVTHSQAALEHFHDAWPLTNTRDPWKAGDGYRDVQVTQRRSYQALDVLTKTVPCDASSWLIVRRLLDYLLSDQDAAEPDPTVHVSAPFLTCSSDFNWGYCHRLEVSRSVEGQHSLYIDPLETGLLLLDDDLLQSLRIAWACCRLPFRKHHTDYERYALRLTPREIDQACQLSGNSAGGMFAVAMYAAACGEQVSEEMSASFAIQVENERSLDGELKPEQVTVAPVSPHSIDPKIATGAEVAGLEQVLLAETQTCDGYSGDFATWTAAFALKKRFSAKIVSTSSLADAANRLLGDSRLDELLANVAVTTAKEWERERPERFIEPHYARRLDESELLDSSEQRTRLGVEKQQSLREPLLDEKTRNSITLRPGHQESIGDQELTKLIQLAIDDRRAKEPGQDPPRGARLILAEDANAGKTIFTYRLKHFFASQAGQEAFFSGKPALVCRWENRTDSTAWPEEKNADAAAVSLRRNLELAVAKALGHSTGTSAAELVAYALRKHRVVLIFDAADQAKEPGPLLNALATLPEWHGCHVIVTGRSFRFSQDDGPALFPADDWTFTTLLGFDNNQQARYLNDVLQNEVRANEANDFAVDAAAPKSLFENHADIAELLEVPGMIEMARELLLQERAQTPSGPIRLSLLKTRCDFYWEYYNRKLLGEAVSQRHPELKMEKNSERWQMMLAVTAFRMVLESLTSYSASGETLTAIKRDVIRYCKEYAPDASWDDEDKTADFWQALTSFSALSDHGALEPHLDTHSLSWRHKGWMEFFLALFFAKYATPAALAKFDFDLIRPQLTHDDPQRAGFRNVDREAYSDDKMGREALFRAVFTQITNDKQWYWGWRMATEIPRVPNRPPLHPRHLSRALGTLFYPPARGIRPTELMYYAFYLFEQDEATPESLRKYATVLLGAAEVMAEFRRPFQERVDTKDAVALQLLDSFRPCPPPELIERFEAWKAISELQGKTITDDELWEADPCVFWQGLQFGIDVYSHSRRVRVLPFAMQNTTVTRAEYRLFDESFESSCEFISHGTTIKKMVDENAGDDSKNRFSGDDCPIIGVDWFDAFCFAKMLGPEYRLPSGSEWEYGCRAGKDKRDDFFHFGSGLTTNQANFYESHFFRTVPVKHYPSNKYGLYQMHGNVWEWCSDWHIFGLFMYANKGLKPIMAEFGPIDGATRVLRGGAFLNDAHKCSSASCDGEEPFTRKGTIGFRVALGRRSLSPSPSSSVL